MNADCQLIDLLDEQWLTFYDHLNICNSLFNVLRIEYAAVT